MKKGFTLVELLVVIAIIGILAVAVVAAINPAARINTAKTNTAKSDTKVVANAIERCITDFLTTNPGSAESAAITACDTEAEIKINPVASGQALNSAAAGASVCFSELTGVASTYVKYTHTSAGATSYVETAGAACAAGV